MKVKKARGFPGGASGKELASQCWRLERRVFSPCLGREDPLEEDKATHCSILVQRISWAEEPRGLQSRRLQRVRHDRAAEDICIADSFCCTVETNATL